MVERPGFERRSLDYEWKDQRRREQRRRSELSGGRFVQRLPDGGTCNAFEICRQGGAAVKACNTDADRTRPDLLCNPSKLCMAPPDGGTDGTCG